MSVGSFLAMWFLWRMARPCQFVKLVHHPVDVLTAFLAIVLSFFTFCKACTLMATPCHLLMQFCNPVEQFFLKGQRRGEPCSPFANLWAASRWPHTLVMQQHRYVVPYTTQLQAISVSKLLQMWYALSNSVSVISGHGANVQYWCNILYFFFGLLRHLNTCSRLIHTIASSNTHKSTVEKKISNYDI